MHAVTMNWLVVANIFAAVSLAAAHQLQASMSQMTVDGTCASIGYSTECCPPDENCQATDGDCQCGADCYEQSDCCDDVYCPSGNIIYDHSICIHMTCRGKLRYSTSCTHTHRAKNM